MKTQCNPHPARFLRLAVGITGLAALALHASADTIYFDDFNDQQNLNAGGPYTQTLAGSTPTTRSGTFGGSASAAWGSGAEVGGWGQRDYADSNVATPTSSNFLPFVPDSSRIYKLQMTVNTTALAGGGSSSWFTVGFTGSQHNWNGADAGTIDTANLVRFNSNTVATITYTRTGADLVAAGIQYVGWVTDLPGGINMNAANQVSIDNFSLTAGVPNPTVTYDGNGSDGGSVPTDPSSPYSYGGTATVVGAGTMTRSGFNFIGWNTAANGMGTDYSPAATFTIENDTTLYAKWIPVGSYTLTYDGNGNTSGTVPVDGSSPYSGGSTVTVLGNTGSLSRTSFSFSGWNTAADGSGTTYNAGGTFTINANTTLFSQWTPGPDYVWNNGAATSSWNTDMIDANWSGATWSNSATNNAIFTTGGSIVYLDSSIVANAVNVGNAGANFSSMSLSEGLTGTGLTASSLTVQGSSSNSGDYGANPTLTVNSVVTLSGDAAVGRANLAITAGTFTANRIISAAASSDWARLVVSGGTVTATNGVDGSVNTGATFAIDLNGGTLETPSVRVADREVGFNNFAWLTFNGGTLKATGADNADFITTYGGGQTTFVEAGGAVIDTNGLNIGLSVNMVRSGSSTGGLAKLGTGTLTLGGNVYNYRGNTVINDGTLVFADTSSLEFLVTEAPAANMVTGPGAATFNGAFTIDTTAITGNTGFIWTLVDRATLTGESFGATFSVVGFVDPEDDGIWTMTDAKGDWSFSEATGELTLDVGNDYDNWGSPYGLAQGSEDGDLDNDGLTNQEEYAFGLIPNSGSSVNPIVVPLDKTSGTFRYTRRATPLSTGLTYTVWTSTDLATWTEDTGATLSQTVTGTVGEVETVEATITGTLPLAQPKLFIQVLAQ